MSVHYKFKSALDYDTVTFDGLHISVGDLKAAISQQKRIGKTSDFDLKITNAQTKEVYVDDNTLIPKNTSLLVARVPLAQQPKKQWEEAGKGSGSLHKDVSFNKGVADLSRMEGSEQDKINAMISQSTFDYDPSNYLKIRGQNQRGIVPPNYTCYKCQKKGHWIKDCPTANSTESVEIRRSTGIPRSFMVPVDGPKAPGAMMTPSGTFAVPAVDHEAYLASETAGDADAPPNAPATTEPSVPDELICSLCRDLLTDAVMIPCCGNSFCDECIRGALLESEDHECPDCREKEIAPTTLIPNRFLRNSVSMFCNQTGYSRRMPHRPSIPKAKPIEQAPPPVVHPIPAAIPPSNGPPTAAPSAVSQLPPNQAPIGASPTNGPQIVNVPRLDEQRASTPTIDERREPVQSTFRPKRVQPPFAPSNGGAPFKNAPPPSFDKMGPRPDHAVADRYPDRKPPIGIKESPPLTVPGEDPLEAFNRMIREKEMRAKRREEERRRREEEERRRRRPMGSRSRSRSPRVRSPSPRSRSISPPPLRPRSPRSPRPRSPSPRAARPARPRYSRSRSNSPRPRMRRSPWSPRRRRSRSLSLSRSPSLRRRHRSPLAYSPPPHSPPRSPLRSPLRSPPRSPHRIPLRTPPRSMSPHRHPGLYEELLPPSRNIEPPYVPRYGSRNNLPPSGYVPIGEKTIPPLIPGIGMPPGYRGRYEAPPFDDVPPGVDPTISAFEPSPFEKPIFGPGPGSDERERLPPSNYRDSYRPPYDGPGPGPGFRDLPNAPQGEIAVHISEQPPRFRDNYRGPPFHGREQGPFRDGHPYRESGSQPPFRESNYRSGPPFRENSSFRNAPYREPPVGFRETGVPFGSPGSEPREPIPPNYIDPNFRDGFRDDNGPREGRYRPNTRDRGRGGRHYPNPDFRNHSERGIRDRERYEDREPSDKFRDPEKRYDKRRDDREERMRNYDKNPKYEKEREREYDRGTPEKKPHISPKKSRDGRERKRSESRGRSRDRDKRDKKEEKEKISADRGKEHKEKEKKVKDRKKKKREKEKEKDGDKKKKRDKKDKKEKDTVKRGDNVQIHYESGRNPSPVIEKPESEPTKDKEKSIGKLDDVENKPTEKVDSESKIDTQEEKPKFDLYGDEAAEAVDKATMASYVRTEKSEPEKSKTDETENKEEPFDGIELQANADELDLKIDCDAKEMLAPLPELSKWEVDDDNEKSKEPGEITSPDEEEDNKVTSEVLKRAENAIFAKTISSIKPIEIKKINSDRLKLYNEADNKKASIKITVPSTDMERRSIEMNYRRRLSSKTPPPRVSVKERLGGKIEDIRRVTEMRVLHSTVERVKSRSKTPKKEGTLGSRVVMGDKEKDRRGVLPFDSSKGIKSDREKHEMKPRSSEKSTRGEKKIKEAAEEEQRRAEKTTNIEGKPQLDRKRSLLDEANFEPDYDETVESETENFDNKTKRERSPSPTDPEAKKLKLEENSIKLDLTNVKKKPDTESESSSDSDDSSSSTSSEDRRRKRKKKRSKKKKKRAASDSDSESDSSGDDHRKKKKKRKHKKKSSKKKKKSKR